MAVLLVMLPYYEIEYKREIESMGYYKQLNPILYFCTYTGVGFVAIEQFDFFISPRPLLDPEMLCDG